MASHVTPSSRSWKRSPAPSGMRSPGNSSRPRSAGRPRTGPRKNCANAPTAGERPVRPPTNPACSRPRGEMSAGTNGAATAPAVGGLFFPQNQALGIDHTGFSPRVQQKIVYAGVESISYQQASDLGRAVRLGGRAQAGRAVGQANRSGADRPARRGRREASATAPDGQGRRREPEAPCPPVAMVSVDGGRIQIRSNRRRNGVEQTSHWRESKVVGLGNLSKRGVSELIPTPMCLVVSWT